MELMDFWMHSYKWLVCLAIIWLLGLLIPMLLSLLPEALNLLPGDSSLLREALSRSQGFDLSDFMRSIALKTTHVYLLRPTVILMYIGASLDIIETFSSPGQPHQFGRSDVDLSLF
jgi:hypothetical protein